MSRAGEPISLFEERNREQMNMKISKIVIALLLCFFILKVNGQAALNDSSANNNDSKIKHKSFIVPAILIGYGVVGLTSPALKHLNSNIRNELDAQHLGPTHLDDLTQYAPTLSVYAINALGIPGRHSFKDRTIVMATAYIIMASSVGITKKASDVERPDGSNRRSFPSGHTANAFLGAEFLYQEYKDVSVWYGVTGYVVAAGTGFLRMSNNKHWFTDVAAGAGIGILSTKIAYLVHPFFKRTLFKDKEHLNGMVVPVYNGEQYGLGLTITF